MPPRSQTTAIACAQENSPLEEEGLLCCILASLPPLEVFELRRVCKLWNSVLNSRAFLQAWCLKHDNEGPAAWPWLVMARKPVGALPYARELIAFNSSSGTWIPLDTLLTSRCSEAALAALGGLSFPLVANPFMMPEDVATFDDFMAVGSQDGLVCFLCFPPKGTAPLAAEMVTEFDRGYRSDLSNVFEVEAYYLLVLNPVTGSHSILPPPLKHTTDLRSWAPWFHLRISLQALPHHHYRVFLQTSLFDHPGDLEIYDSRSRSWKAGRSCWGHTDAKVGGALELDNADLLQFAYGTATVFAYNVELDQWSCLYATFVNSTFRSWLWLPNGSTLLRHRGRILLAAVHFSKPHSPSGFVVWELHLHANPPPDADHRVAVAEWVEIARTPHHLFPDVCLNNSISGVKAKLISSGSIICMTIVDYVNYYSGTFCTPLVYDIDCDSWYHLPPYKGSHDYVAVFGMQPSLVGRP